MFSYLVRVDLCTPSSLEAWMVEKSALKRLLRKSRP
mgnify:CR=1 FL=1